jgi:hypothetical protein
MDEGAHTSTEGASVNPTSLPWVEDVSPGLLKFIGVVEVLGALGLTARRHRLRAHPHPDRRRRTGVRHGPRRVHPCAPPGA